MRLQHDGKLTYSEQFSFTKAVPDDLVEALTAFGEEAAKADEYKAQYDKLIAMEEELAELSETLATANAEDTRKLSATRAKLQVKFEAEGGTDKAREHLIAYQQAENTLQQGMLQLAEAVAKVIDHTKNIAAGGSAYSPRQTSYTGTQTPSAGLKGRLVTGWDDAADGARFSTRPMINSPGSTWEERSRFGGSGRLSGIRSHAPGLGLSDASIGTPVTKRPLSPGE